MQHFFEMLYAGLLAKIVYTVTVPGTLLIFAARLITQVSWEGKKKKCSCVETKLHFHNYLQKLSRLVLVFLAAICCFLACRKKTQSLVILHQRSFPYHPFHTS